MLTTNLIWFISLFLWPELVLSRLNSNDHFFHRAANHARHAVLAHAQAAQQLARDVRVAIDDLASSRSALTKRSQPKRCRLNAAGSPPKPVGPGPQSPSSSASHPTSATGTRASPNPTSTPNPGSNSTSAFHLVNSYVSSLSPVFFVIPIIV